MLFSLDVDFQYLSLFYLFSFFKADSLLIITNEDKTKNIKI